MAGEGALGTDLPRVPPQGLKKDLKVILTPIQVSGPTQPTTAATSAHGRRIVMTRVPSDAAVLEGITPSGMETVSQEDREDSMIAGALSKADRKLSKRLAQEMSQGQAPKGTDSKSQGGAKPKVVKPTPTPVAKPSYRGHGGYSGPCPNNDQPGVRSEGD